MIIKGRLVNNKGVQRIGLASKRIKTCSPALSRHGLNFPPLYFGTINIVLNKPISTNRLIDRNRNHIFVKEQSIVKCDNRFKPESWDFIPIRKIDGKKVKAFILRTSVNFHGDSIIEIVAEKLFLDPDKEHTFQIDKLKFPMASKAIVLAMYSLYILKIFYDCSYQRSHESVRNTI